MSRLVIREAKPEDSNVILNFILELAKYENLEPEVLATESSIRDSIFGPESSTKALICEKEGIPIGYAIYFFNYSTWLGKHGLYLEDLYISQNERGFGAGKAFLKYLARIAVSKDCGRFEWSVLDWNQPAIDLYKSLGAEPQSEWIVYRLSGQKLLDLADSN
jgi:GNAT superfamily N-acetyltransferase